MKLYKKLSAIYLGSLIACLNISPSFAETAIPAEVKAYQPMFLEWAKIAAEKNTSPAKIEAGDYVSKWMGPDHRIITTVVKIPHPAPGSPDVVVEKVPAGADARPYFEKAVNDAIAKKAGKIIIPPGDYTFKTFAKDGSAHWKINGLKDVVIEGKGANLIFAKDNFGILLGTSQRVSFNNFTMNYDLLMTSSGVMKKLPDGRNVVVVDSKYPLTDTTPAYNFVGENMAPDTNNIDRYLFPKDAGNVAANIGNKTYYSKNFKDSAIGHRYKIYHQWYGGVAFRAGDSPGPNQSEDISLVNVTLYSSPGMGFFPYGVKRGFAMKNCKIMIKKGSNNLSSAEYDGIHIAQLGGDLILSGNTISDTGDDKINLNNAVVSIYEVNGTTLKMSGGSRLIAVGDDLGYFDRYGRYLGKNKVASVKYLGGLNYQFVVDKAVPNVTTSTTVRDISTLAGRYVVSGNVGTKGGSVLVQIPNGLVVGNRFEDGFLKILTNNGTFKEGVGAFNVLINHNWINNAPWAYQANLAWGAISLYSLDGDNRSSIYSAHKDVSIVNNIINGARQGCIYIGSAQNVSGKNNSCSNINLSKWVNIKQPINIEKSYGVNIQ